LPPEVPREILKERKTDRPRDIAAGLRKLVDWKIPLLRRARSPEWILSRLRREKRRTLRAIVRNPVLWLLGSWTWDKFSGMAQWQAALASAGARLPQG
jgi:hypothetical protein